MPWKYALVKINEYKYNDVEIEETGKIMHIYTDDKGEYTLFCDSQPATLEEVIFAAKDIVKDGLNRWFFDNGKFILPEHCESNLDWIKND
jgi:hypothetical protein